ncbi:outer membrane protein [Hyphococcus sp. DH-69]|uniref:outer membrane protein n=1 Tax=Hyphococcus formosus TaxID=3143534 RepID=UPI00398AAE0F
MRKIMIAAAMIGATAAGSAQAETYGKIFGGAIYGSDHDFTLDIPGTGTSAGEYDTDTGFVVGGAYGYNLNKFFSVEGEIAYRTNEVESGTIGGITLDGDDDINSLSFMGNAIFNAPSYAGFTPYVGAGAGAARIGGAGEHDTVFAYQAFGGVKKNLTEKIDAGIEYRYFDADTATLTDAGASLATEYDSHSLNLVLSRSF